MPLFTGTWDLGNVAATGLTQSPINAGFTTTSDPEIIEGGPFAGRFIYQVQGSFNFLAGEITAVPEPSLAIAVASCCLVPLGMRLRRWYGNGRGPLAS